MDKNSLMNKRALYVADRVVISQTSFLLITGILVLLFELLGQFVYFILTFGWIICIPITVFSIAFLYGDKENVYLNRNWTFSYAHYAIAWCSLGIYIGLLLDFFVGRYNSVIVSIVLAIIYVIGYAFARLIRWLQNQYSNTEAICVAILVILIIIISGFTFMYVNVTIYADYQITSHINDWFSSSLPQASFPPYYNFYNIYIYSWVFTIGLPISIGALYSMIYCLYNDTWFQVEIETPNKLYIKMLAINMVVIFLIWVFLTILFPPLAGGGGGGKDKKKRRSSSSGSSWSRNYHRRRYIHTYHEEDTYKKFKTPPSYINNTGWYEIGLQMYQEQPNLSA